MYWPDIMPGRFEIMKKIFFSLVILVSLGFLWFRAGEISKTKIKQVKQDSGKSENYKKTILRFALVADSENDNEDLKKALDQAKGSGVNFVIGLGDWSTIGTKSDLTAAKNVFDASGLKYYLTPGDHDLWDSRNRGDDALFNYIDVFGEPNHSIEASGIKIDIVDNSDIYKGIDQKEWDGLLESLRKPAKLHFVFSHKTPFHPQSSHVMGSENEQVAIQAKKYIELLEENHVDGFFAGDLHFFARFSSTGGSTSGGNSSANGVRITTIGAMDRERNFQGPRYGVVTVYDDYSWDVSDVEIR